ncbi:hypothetical protein HK405_002794 [Cladochytrium tenue]|nr:hypothetical protein HK405_002794 [Cladochytrium tenue]
MPHPNTTAGVVVTAAATAVAALAGMAAISAALRLARMHRRVRALRRLNPCLPVYTSFISRLSPWVLFGPLPRNWLAAFPGGWELKDPVGPFYAASAASAAAAAANAAAARADARTKRLGDSSTGGSEVAPPKVFAVVTPDDTWLYVGEARLAHEVLSTRNKDFARPAHYYGSLLGFHHVLSADGSDWRRQRRVLAPQFSDRNNALVLAETVRIAESMFSSWESGAVAKSVAPGSSGVASFEVPITADMGRFALKVVCAAGFGFDVDWQDSIPPGRKYSIEDTLLNTSRLQIYLAVAPAWIRPLFGKRLARAVECMSEYDAHVAAAVAAARDPDSVGNGSLLNALVKAASSPSDGGTLSNDELLGNIFLLFQAGYVTTATTLNNSILLLASDEEAQDRLCDEAAAVFSSGKGPGSVSLKDLQRLPFAQAVMNETMRLHPVVTNTAVWTASTPVQTLENLALPAGTHIYVAIRGLHRDPDSWGPDADVFRPSRWLSSPTSDDHDDVKDDNTTTSPAPSGAFVPFSEGPRACLGRRFAQIEFIALLSLIALRYRWSLPEAADPARVLDASVAAFMAIPSYQNVVMTPR